MKIVKIIAITAIGFLPFLIISCTDSTKNVDEVTIVVEEAKSDSTKSDTVKVEGKCGTDSAKAEKCGEGKCG